ncbi:MAG TPA: hypothetical protein VF835_05175 [Rhizomicrobium sp.]
MRLPKPEPGLVVRYEFLWAREAERGHTSGKDRPACIVATLEQSRDPAFVLFLAITHTSPRGDTAAVEIPPRVCRNLGLDDERSWVVVSEYNIDEWPNAGLRPIPGKPRRFSYGYVPPSLFSQIKSAFAAAHAKGKTRGTSRT